MKLITLDNCYEEVITNTVIDYTPLYNYKKKLYFKIKKDIQVKLSNGEIIIIPEGYETDLSSVPKIFWSFLPPIGDFDLASIIHDYLYTERNKHSMIQIQADAELYKWSNKLNGIKGVHSKWTFFWKRLDNKIRFILVLIFGFFVWLKLIMFNKEKK